MSERPESTEETKPERLPSRPEFTGFLPISALARGKRFNESLASRIERQRRRQKQGWR